MKYLKGVLTGYLEDVKLAYTTTWELDETVQLLRTEEDNEETAEGGKCLAKR